MKVTPSQASTQNFYLDLYVVARRARLQPMGTLEGILTSVNQPLHTFKLL